VYLRSNFGLATVNLRSLQWQGIGAVTVANRTASHVHFADVVLAYHEVEGSLDYYPVLDVWAHEDPVIVELVIDGEVIFTTPEHPFYTDGGDWIPAVALQAGDEIRRADWDTGTVETITFIASPQTMYNFTVATSHTYFVGEGQWLVHNACPLRANIGARPGEQAYHLIPNQHQVHPFVQRATAGGWDQHAAYNGMALPNNATAATSGPYHIGSHPSYNAMVDGRLTSLQNQAVQNNWTTQQAAQQLRNLAQQLRSQISNMPPGVRLD
jgi:hypothetical protein